jgi:hypothetical protein
MAYCDVHRIVFISASYLVDEYKSIPKDVLAVALFFFGSKRSWIFPVSDDDKAESRAQLTQYLDFPDEFKELILTKEDRNEVFWLKPECSYEQVSTWFQSLDYKGLQLDDAFWLTQPHGKQVVDNYTAGEHDYRPVIELVNQSNLPQLIAVLRYSDLTLKND